MWEQILDWLGNFMCLGEQISPFIYVRDTSDFSIESHEDLKIYWFRSAQFNRAERKKKGYRFFLSTSCIK